MYFLDCKNSIYCLYFNSKLASAFLALFRVIEKESQAVRIRSSLAAVGIYGYNSIMIIITSPDEVSKRKALGYLSGRFSFRSWATGEMMIPEDALSHLTLEGIEFSVEGPATYEHRIPAIRDSSATAIQ